MQFSSKALKPTPSNDPQHNGVAPPLYRSAAYGFESCQDIHKAFIGEKNAYVYGRISNPTVAQLENRLALLSSCIGAVCFSSGMSAIATTLLALTKSGSNIVCSKSLFVSTFSLFKNSFSKYDVSAKYFDIGKEEDCAKLIDKNTKAIFTEIIGNPRMDFANLTKLGQIAKKHQIPLIVDSTTLPPNLINLSDFDVSLIVTSLTKYISGQARFVAGALFDTGKFNWTKKPPQEAEDLVQKYRRLSFLTLIRKQYIPDFGSCLAPEVAELALMGLETLDLRIQKVSTSAQKLAQFLENNAKVLQVYFPGLTSSKFHKIAKSHCEKNLYGGLLSFDVGSKEKAFKVIDNLKNAHIMTNLGDVRTLVVHPFSTIFVSLTEEERIIAGATPGLIRVAVGIEDSDDIIADFKQALEKI